MIIGQYIIIIIIIKCCVCFHFQIRWWHSEAQGWCSDMWVRGCAGYVGDAKKVRIRVDEFQPHRSQKSIFLGCFCLVQVSPQYFFITHIWICRPALIRNRLVAHNIYSMTSTLPHRKKEDHQITAPSDCKSAFGTLWSIHWVDKVIWYYILPTRVFLYRYYIYIYKSSWMAGMYVGIYLIYFIGQHSIIDSSCNIDKTRRECCKLESVKRH